MRIGVIGSGNVGGTLGKRWASNGNTVFFATRDPESAAIRTLLAESGPTAAAGSLRDAVAQSEIALLATPWRVTRQLLESAGDFDNRILIDATNPLAPDLSCLECANTISGAESVAQWAPYGARRQGLQHGRQQRDGRPRLLRPGCALLLRRRRLRQTHRGSPHSRTWLRPHRRRPPLPGSRPRAVRAALDLARRKVRFGRDIAFQFLRR